MNRLAIVTSHPIQYNAPWFKLLNERGRIQIKVFYTWGKQSQGAKYDPGFGKIISWDIPLLEGYEYEFISNTSSDPGSHHFNGIINPSLNKIITAWSPTAVLVIGWSFNSHLKCIRHFKGKVPLIFRGDSTDIDKKPWYKKWLRDLGLKRIYSHIDYFLFVGTQNKKYFISHGARENQLIYAPHAIDNERFNTINENQTKELNRLKSSLGFSEADLVILFCGKLEPKKNPEFIIRLAELMQDEHIKLLIVGNGQLENVLKSKSKKDARIKFIDFQNQSVMPLIYRLADIFIFPSMGPGETWGLAVNEAMASGLPIMVSDKAGCAIDLVSSQVNGIVFDPDSEIEMCTLFIHDCLKKEGYLKKLKESSKIKIQSYSFSTIVESIENLVITSA